MAQMSLANALFHLAKEEGSTARLREAASACREALSAQGFAFAPLQRAAAEICLGNILQALGVKETGTVALEAAAAAYGKALQEFSRDRTPLQFAVASARQGIARLGLAEHLADMAAAELAVVQIATAILRIREAGDMASAAAFEACLPNALALLETLANYADSLTP